MLKNLLWRTYRFYWTLFKKRQTQISEMLRLKKEQHELFIMTWLFIIRSNIYTRAFLRTLTAKSFIVDIQPGFKYPSTELLLWKNPKGSTRYPMTLSKRNSTAGIFLWTFKLFLDKLFHKAAPNHWL